MHNFSYCLAQCYDDPDLFNTQILGRNSYWTRQREITKSVVRYRDTVVYSGNAVGKDYVVAGLIHWWLFTRRNSMVIVTAPGQTLLGSVLWKEVRRALENTEVPLDAKVSTGMRASPQVVDLGNGWCAIGYSTDCVERLSGQHAANVLVIVEEASGLEPHAWEAIDGMKYERMIAIGNPIRPDGRFVELIRQAQRDSRDDTPDSLRVNAIQIPSTDSPHAELDHSPWGLADRTWMEASFRRHGRNSLWCGCHVFAQIPTVGKDSLLDEVWLDWASSQPRAPVSAGDPRAGKPRMAIDLAEGVGRDQTVILVRDDLGILEVVHSNTVNLPEAAEKARRLAIKWHVPHNRISYDKLGVGRDFANHLMRVGITGALPYCGSASPMHRHDFVNLRTEAAWNLRHRLDPNWVPDPRNPHAQPWPFHIPAGSWWSWLREELVALEYDLAGNKTRLIEKSELRDRLGRSPDLSDALIQSFAW